MVRKLFKLPKYRKFTFEPRYYDEVKEEIEERVAKIEREYRAEQKNPEAAANFKRDWEQALNRRQEQDRNSNLMVAYLVMLLVVSTVGYLVYGNIALYVAVAMLGVFVVYRRLPKKE